MALPPTARSRYGKKKRGTSGGYGEGAIPYGGGGSMKPKKDPFAGVTWTNPGPMSERERDPFWSSGTRDPYYQSRVDPSLIGINPEALPPGESEDEYEPFVMPDWKDALYNQAMDELQRAEADAKAKKAALTKEALIRLGSRELAAKILGANDPSLGAISSDPNTSFSTMAQIARQYNQLVSDVNVTRNDQGLWFSSTRGNDLTRAAYESQKAGTEATQDVQDYLNDLQSNLLDALREYTFSRISAEEAARDRAIQLYLLSGGRKKKKKTTPAPPGTQGPPAPVPPGGPGTEWPIDPIYNVIGGKPYGI